MNIHYLHYLTIYLSNCVVIYIFKSLDLFLSYICTSIYLNFCIFTLYIYFIYFIYTCIYINVYFSIICLNLNFYLFFKYISIYLHMYLYKCLFIYTCIYINVYLSIYQSLLMVIRSQFYDTVRGPANRDVHPSLGAQTYEDET